MAEAFGVVSTHGPGADPAENASNFQNPFDKTTKQK
jgi:hypothetical protein